MIPTNGKGGDEFRYLWYAQNMLNGFYSPQSPNIQLINGPGYPIILMPFLALKLPLISMTIINALFYYFSIILLFKSLKKIVSFSLTLTFSLAWACYLIAYQNIPFIHTETFTYFLITILIYLTTNVFRNSVFSIKQLIYTGFILGYIVLTKMIFGYVIIFILAGSIILWIINQKKINFRKILVINLIALITVTPYLIYTYNLTGRLFYWGMGSDSLYWMTSTSDAEYGDWTSRLVQNPLVAANYNIKGADSILIANHQEDFNEILKYQGIEQDDEYYKFAIRNIKAHPLKYAQNVILNIGRLIFHYPFSQAIHKPRTLLIFPINGALLTLMFFSLIPTLLNWRRIPFYLKFLLFFIFLYLGASILVTALVRMFTIVVPILLFWIAYIVQNTLKIKLKIDHQDQVSNNNKQIQE